MRKYLFRAGFALMTLAIALAFAHFRAFGRQVNSSDPIFGTWKMDQGKSVNNRRGDHATYPTQHIRTLAAESDDLRNTLLNSPNSAPAYSYSGKLDGQDHPDPRGRKDQTLAHWRLAPDLIVRLQKTNGKPSEWVVYTVSPDGKVFTSVSWVPEHPELQDLEVFTRAQ